MAQEGTLLQLRGRLAGKPSAGSPPCCLKLERPQVLGGPQRDMGEWVKFRDLEDEVDAGCEKCTIIYNGIQIYRQEFEDRRDFDGNPAAGMIQIFKNAFGICCHLQRTPLEGDNGLLSLRFYSGKGKERRFLTLQL
jgi:hypothetical protein